jgi:TrmH family RNA methyltransferase
MIVISSLTNPRIKSLIKLEKSSNRAEAGLFTVEGKKEILLCAEAGYKITELYYCPDIVTDHSLPEHPIFKGVSLFEITLPVFEKIAYRESRDGYFAVAKAEYKSLAQIKLSDNPLIIVLEAVEKPGNLGATAIRSSLGCLFTTQVVCCTNESCLQWLHDHQIKVLAAALTASVDYHEQNMKIPTALVFGTEADGLSNYWLTQADLQIKIPMRGKIDSLNVSGSCAIITFEAMRQRGFGSH